MQSNEVADGAKAQHSMLKSLLWLIALVLNVVAERGLATSFLKVQAVGPMGGLTVELGQLAYGFSSLIVIGLSSLVLAGFGIRANHRVLFSFASLIAAVVVFLSFE